MIRNGDDGITFAGVHISDVRLIWIGWVLPLVTIVCSMSVHALSGNARAMPFFVSESDYPGLERWIFTSGLAVSGVVICTLSYRLNRRIQNKESGWHRTASVAGPLAGLALSGLAIANIYDALLLHTFASIMLFGGGFAWGASMHKLYTFGTGSGKKLRIKGLWMTAIGLVTMHVSIGGYIFLQREKFDMWGTGIGMLDLLQPAINIAAPAEYLLIGGLMVVMASIGKDIRALKDSHPATQHEPEPSLLTE